MKNFIFFLFLHLYAYSYAQFSENHFSSYNWSGDLQKFRIETSGRIQLDADKDASPAQLVTPSDRVLNTLWECYVKMEFNPTSSNYAKIYLCSSTSTPSEETDGLFIRVGYSKKNICLLSQSGKKATTLISGTEKRLDSPSVGLFLRMELDGYGNFNLYSRLENEEEYRLEGNCILTNLPASRFFGIVCIFSATRKNHFTVDGIRIETLHKDEEPDPGPTGTSPIEIVQDISTGSYRINYQFDTGNNYCRMIIFDISGRQVDFPYNKEALGSEGTLFWHGKNKSGATLRPGIYILYMEIYTVEGVLFHYKLPITVR